MSVLIVKMAKRPFFVRCVTHRRWRRFTAETNLFHTQYDTPLCSVFYAGHDDMLHNTFYFFVPFRIENFCRQNVEPLREINRNKIET